MPPERPQEPPPPPAPPEDAIVVAQVLGAHGKDGGLNVRVLSDVPGRLDAGRIVLDGARAYRILHSRPAAPGACLLRLEGLVSRRQAAQLAGRWLTIPAAETPPLPEGEYFHHQLIGMTVRTAAGETLGQIREILETGSNDVYIVGNASSRVSASSGELLLPATAQVVRQVDVAARLMVVELPDGLR